MQTEEDIADLRWRSDAARRPRRPHDAGPISPRTSRLVTATVIMPQPAKTGAGVSTMANGQGLLDTFVADSDIMA